MSTDPVGMQNPMVQLMLANTRAGELRAEALGESLPKTVFKGAATHTGAFLLQALDEQGWTLVEKDVLREARAFLDTRLGPGGKPGRPGGLIARIDRALEGGEAHA